MVRITKFFTLIVLGLLLSFNPFRVSAQADIQKAVRLTESEQYDDAEKELKSIISKTKSSEAYFYMGENYLAMYFADSFSMTLKEATDLARAQYQEGVKADTGLILNYVGLGKVALLINDDKNGLAYLKKANSMLPPYKKVKQIQNPQTYAFSKAKIAEAYIRGSKTDTTTALPMLREALNINKKDANIFIILGNIYNTINDATKAIYNYNQALYVDANSPVAKIKIGNIYVRGQNLTAGLDYFTEITKSNPDFAAAYREFGDLYAMAGQHKKAKEYYKKYLDLSGNNIPAKIRYISSLFKAKDYEECIKQIEDVLAVDQSKAFLYRLVAYSCYEKDPPEYEKGVKYIEDFFKVVKPEKIIKKDYAYYGRLQLKTCPDYVQMQKDTVKLGRQITNLVKNYEDIKKPSPQKDAIKLKIDSLNSIVANLTVNIKRDSVMIEKAFSNFRKAYDMDVNDIDIISEMATNYRSVRKFNEAAEMYQTKIELCLKNTELNKTPEAFDYLTVGNMFYQAQNYDKAEQSFNAVIQKYPDDVRGYLWMANTYAGRDPDLEQGLAKEKFELLITKASADPVKNFDELFQSYRYMGSYNCFLKKDYPETKKFIAKMVAVVPPANKDYNDYMVKTYSLQTKMYFDMKDWGKLLESGKKILEFDEKNGYAKQMIKYAENMIKGVVAADPDEISGKVTGTDGKGILNVSVRVKEASNETYTTTDGSYRFVIPKDGGILIFSAKGYKTKEVPVTKSRVYNVKLEK